MYVNEWNALQHIYYFRSRSDEMLDCLDDFKYTDSFEYFYTKYAKLR